MAGKLYPTAQYFNDLSRTMNGLSQLYPSKFVAFVSKVSKENIPGLVKKITGRKEDFGDVTVETDPTTLSYYISRKQGASVLEDLTGYEFGTKAPGAGQSKKYTGLGDINFLSYDVQDGVVYNEIYLNVDMGVCEREFNVIDPIDANQNNTVIDESIFDIEPVSNPETSFDFNCVMLFYNLYQVDPTTGKQTAVIAYDMPLGVYVIDDNQKIAIDENAYGATVWATRISSRFAMGDNTVVVDPSTDQQSINSMALAVQEIKNLADAIKQRQATMTKETDGIKERLTAIKNLTNTPYIKGDAWYVNGRYVADVITESEITNIIRGRLNAEIMSLILNNKTIHEMIKETVLEYMPILIQQLLVNDKTTARWWTETVNKVQNFGHDVNNDKDWTDSDIRLHEEETLNDDIIKNQDDKWEKIEQERK